MNRFFSNSKYVSFPQSPCLKPEMKWRADTEIEISSRYQGWSRSSFPQLSDQKYTDSNNLIMTWCCRQLFEGEQVRLSRKYGRYCINNRRSSIIVDHNLQFFSSYQFTNSLELRVDAMLIKPIQRLTRYHMFLSSIAKTCRELGLAEAALEFSLALESVLAAASHTNTMMWIGKMVNCPIDLPSQGQLIKQGKVRGFCHSNLLSSQTFLCCRFQGGTSLCPRAGAESSPGGSPARSGLRAICSSSRRPWCCVKPVITCQNQTILIWSTRITSGEAPP